MPSKRRNFGFEQDKGGVCLLAESEAAVYWSGVDLSSWPGLSLRPITADDTAKLQEIYASTREEELQLTGWSPVQKAAFLRQQFDAQHTWYQTHYQGGNFDLLLDGGEPVGRLYVYRQSHDLNLVDIALLPPRRGRGLGTFLLRQLLAEADRTDRTVTLHVEFFNRARSLYERSGFAYVGGDDIYLEMRRPPSVGIS